MGAVDIQIHVGGECQASRSGCFITGEGAPGAHCAGDWVRPRVGLDNVEEKITDPSGTRTPNTSVDQNVPSRYTDYATAAPKHVAVRDFIHWVKYTLLAPAPCMAISRERIPWLSFHKRIVPTERPPLVSEF
jgi:hypothetical protein